MASTTTTNTTSGAFPPPPPPPTPSNQNLSLPSSATTETSSTSLSQYLLHHLNPTPSLTLPPSLKLRRNPPSTHPHPPPTISLLHSQPRLLSSAATDHGFFHLTDHDLPCPPPQPDSSTLSLHPPNLSPLGLDLENDEDEDTNDGFLVFDEESSSTMLPGVVDYAREMGRVGVEVVEVLLEAAGLRSPFKDGTVTPRWLLWVYEEARGGGGGGGREGRRWRYPYVVCLQHEVSWRKTEVSLVGDDGSEEVKVMTRPDSVLVTLGDIAQVWSNGRFKKVRARALPSFLDSAETGQVTMSLMVTLSTESVISPLPRFGISWKDENNSPVVDDEEEEDNKFCSFPFEQYAWRLYNETLNFKDPLLRYRLE